MLANTKYCTCIFSYLGDGHGDVEELAPPSLRNGASEEQLQPVFGEQRLLTLKTQRRSFKSFTCVEQNIQINRRRL